MGNEGEKAIDFDQVADLYDEHVKADFDLFHREGEAGGWGTPSLNGR